MHLAVSDAVRKPELIEAVLGTRAGDDELSRLVYFAKGSQQTVKLQELNAKREGEIQLMGEEIRLDREQ